MDSEQRARLDKFTQELVDAGRLIEAGWYAMKLLNPHASDAQLRTMRECFFAGAQHLFTSILSILDPENEPTEADLRRMSLIDGELKAFLEQFKKQHGLIDP